MLHACFFYVPTCFMCTFIQYLAFSGTNLLTRCHSASSCFLLFVVSEKLYRKYSRNCTGQKPNILFFRNEAGARRGAEGGHVATRHRAGMAKHGPAPSLCLAPPARLRLRPFAY